MKTRRLVKLMEENNKKYCIDIYNSTVIISYYDIYG